MDLVDLDIIKINKMKKLITITFLFVFGLAFSQNEDLTIKVITEKSDGEKISDAIRAGRAARAAEAAAMSDKDLDIKVPLSINFSDYTHIAIVDVLNSAGKRQKGSYKRIKAGLLSSPLTILSPHDDSKKFKENTFHLRDTKDPKWIYLYFSASRIGVDLNVGIILRNYKNEIVYQATTTNIPYLEVLNNVANF
jgi:hypothetical protein